MRGNQIKRKTAAFVCVCCGGFLIAIGPSFAATALYPLFISTGALSFLFGMTLLLRQRRLPPEERQQAVGRLTEEPETTASQLPTDVERYDAGLRLEEETLTADRFGRQAFGQREARLASTDVAALARGLGTKERFCPPPGTDHSTSEEGFYCFGNLVAAEVPSSTHKR